MTKNDDAVSTVIAMMLILGIIVTLFAIYSATYLPGLKQQSEIDHSREVANAFVRFDSDIDHVVSHKKAARFSEPFSLGGGDILLSPVRSSGLVSVEDRPLVNVTVTNGTGETVKTVTLNTSLVNVSYVPSFTSWEPQGYRWECGVVLVTKDDVAVPQSSRYNTWDEASGDCGAFLERFIDLDLSGDGSEVTITTVNLTRKKDESFITGSGIATLEVNATVLEEKTIEEVTGITFENCTVGDDDDAVSVMMGEILGERCTAVAGIATYNSPAEALHTLTFNSPVNVVNVTLRVVNVEVSVC